MTEDYPCRPSDEPVRRLFCVGNRNLEPWGGGSTPSPFARLRWRGARRGSRGKRRRMRTKPGSPVELAWRWERATRHEFAGWRFIETTVDTSERCAQRDRLAL